MKAAPTAEPRAALCIVAGISQVLLRIPDRLIERDTIDVLHRHRIVYEHNQPVWRDLCYATAHCDSNFLFPAPNCHHPGRSNEISGA